MNSPTRNEIKLKKELYAVLDELVYVVCKLRLAHKRDILKISWGDKYSDERLEQLRRDFRNGKIRD